jgi:glutamate dehydrogenase/leucine dehydrogenase
VLFPVTDPNLTPDISAKLTVADMITGYGVSEAIEHYYNLHNENVKDKRVVIQGWGNVGAAAAYYQAQSGAKIVGIIDKDGGMINENGYSFEDIKRLFLEKEGNKLNSDMLIPFEQVNAEIWSIGAEIFIPAAASRLVQKEQIDQMIKNGLEVISCGANVPFADPQIFFGPISEFTDDNVSVIPDFIANCGMARVFAYLMQNNVEVSDKAIFKDTSETIRMALHNTYEINKKRTQVSKTALEIALKQLS